MFRNIILFVLLFCYVFGFYLGGITVSLLIAVPLYFYSLIHKSFAHEILYVINTSFIRNVIKIWFIIILLSLLYPLLFLTLDYSFFKVTATQLFHLVAAIPVFAYLKYKQYTIDTVENIFIRIFVVQTIIQLVVFSNETLSNLILAFNHYEPDNAVGLGSNVRGKALSAATTYHLTLAYGVCFIIYLKSKLSVRVSLQNVLVGLLIFVGIFFAGRSGFVGCLIGCLGFLYYKNNKQISKIAILLKTVFIVLLCIVMLLSVLYLCFPDYYLLLTEQVFPYAFEFLYSFEKSGSMETASTNRLGEMWNSDFNLYELIWGSGKYSNPDGSYYMQVDPGILRHLLFMGILGYVLLIIYQISVITFWKMYEKERFYSLLIFLFIFIMDFKGVTVGINKFMFAIPLLLSFTYLFLPRSQNSV